MVRRLITILAMLGLVRFCGAAESSSRYIDHVKPILRARCYACHGALKQKAGLRLDTVGSMLSGGDSGPVIRPGEPSKSVLLARVTSQDAEERMPPAHEGERLSSGEVEQIRLWIRNGARAPADERPELDPREHWAFRPIVRPMVPPVSTDRRARNPIDVFLMQAQEKYGLKPREEASRLTLLRRLHLNLTGIPPTPEEITAFRNNASPEFYGKFDTTSYPVTRTSSVTASHVCSTVFLTRRRTYSSAGKRTTRTNRVSYRRGFPRFLTSVDSRSPRSYFRLNPGSPSDVRGCSNLTVRSRDAVSRRRRADSPRRERVWPRRNPTATGMPPERRSI